MQSSASAAMQYWQRNGHAVIHNYRSVAFSKINFNLRSSEMHFHPAIHFLIYRDSPTHIDFLQLEQLFSSIEMQEHIEPSVSSTLSVVVPTWIMNNDRLFQSGRLMSNHQAQTSAHRLPNDAHSRHSASLSQDVGITSVRHSLETQYPPMSPRETQGSPILFSPHIEPGVRHALAALSDDDDVTPSAAWQI